MSTSPSFGNPIPPEINPPPGPAACATDTLVVEAPADPARVAELARMKAMLGGWLRRNAPRAAQRDDAVVRVDQGDPAPRRPLVFWLSVRVRPAARRGGVA